MGSFALRFSILVALFAGWAWRAATQSIRPAVDPPVKKPSKVAPTGPDTSAVRKRAKAVFAVLPADDENPANPSSEEKVKLGRMLYFDKRLSKNHDISCNSCHELDRYGVDNEPTSPGHKGQRGARNSPTVYNASLHIAQFWDGRAKDVEEQAEGPC